MKLNNPHKTFSIKMMWRVFRALRVEYIYFLVPMLVSALVAGAFGIFFNLMLFVWNGQFSLLVFWGSLLIMFPAMYTTYWSVLRETLFGETAKEIKAGKTSRIKYMTVARRAANYPNSSSEEE